MKLDYSVTEDDFKKDKDEEKALKKRNIKTRTSMQATTMNALGSKQPTQPGGQIIMPAQNGWGSV